MDDLFQMIMPVARAASGGGQRNRPDPPDEAAFVTVFEGAGAPPAGTPVTSTQDLVDDLEGALAELGNQTAMQILPVSGGHPAIPVAPGDPGQASQVRGRPGQPGQWIPAGAAAVNGGPLAPGAAMMAAGWAQVTTGPLGMTPDGGDHPPAALSPATPAVAANAANIPMVSLDKGTAASRTTPDDPAPNARQGARVGGVDMPALPMADAGRPRMAAHGLPALAGSQFEHPLPAPVSTGPVAPRVPAPGSTPPAISAIPAASMGADQGSRASGDVAREPVQSVQPEPQALPDRKIDTGPQIAVSAKAQGNNAVMKAHFGPSQPGDLAAGPDLAVASTAASTASNAVSGPPGLASPPASHAPLVAQQIATALSGPARDPRGPVEIALDPPELGRVRMTLSETNGAMTLTIAAERPETADLMRRHLAVLHEEFARAGLDGPSVHISNAGTQGGSGQSRPDGPPMTGTSSDPAGSANDHHGPRPEGDPASSDGLDLRL